MSNKAHILADQNIPFVVDAFGRFGDIQIRPGHEITPESVRDVDVLLVRSVTDVNEHLLSGSKVQFVGAATAGWDHVDLDYLESHKITFAHAKGSNAESVVEYTLAAMLSTGANHGFGLSDKVLGVVGCGAIGGKLVRRARALGMQVLCCDPLLSQKSPVDFISLEELIRKADLVSLHVPLTMDGPHPTLHLLNAETLAWMKPDARLINTSRGSVVDNQALKKAVHEERLAGVVLDVWENEPTPDPELIHLAEIATPHIAGYSFDGKVEGTRTLERAFRQWLAEMGEPTHEVWNPEDAIAESGVSAPILYAPTQDANEAPVERTRWLHMIARQAYNQRGDDTRFRQHMLGSENPQAAFRSLRKSYPVRRAWSTLYLDAQVAESVRTEVEAGLGIKVV